MQPRASCDSWPRAVALLSSLLCLVSPWMQAALGAAHNSGPIFLLFQGKKVDGAANAYAINVSQKRKYRFVLWRLHRTHLLFCDKTTLLWTEGISEGTEWPGCCLWAQRGADPFLFLSLQAVHEQKRRIQQTVGFHCLMLQGVGSIAAFLTCCWLRDGRELHH